MMQKERFARRDWSELSPQARAALILGGIVQIGLLIGALWDIRRRSAEAIRGPKPMWYAVSFINFVGPLSYFVVGRRRDYGI